MRIHEYYQWLKRDWAKVGLVLSTFLFIFLFVFVRETDFVVFILLVQTPLYLLHEAEEYVFPGGFGEYFNGRILNQNPNDGPLSETFIFFVNILLIWIALPLFGTLSLVDYRLGLWIPYFSLFAGISHILLAIKARRIYSPGLVVSLLLNIPFSVWSIIYLASRGVIGNALFNYHLPIGIGINAVLPVMGAILLRKYLRRSDHLDA
jgi:hypothetical protein